MPDNSFLCRDCGATSRVHETRGDGDFTIRTRLCANGHRFQTREVFEKDLPPAKHVDPAAIVALRRAGRTWDSIAKELGVHKRTVQRNYNEN